MNRLGLLLPATPEDDAISVAMNIVIRSADSSQKMPKSNHPSPLLPTTDPSSYNKHWLRHAQRTKGPPGLSLEPLVEITREGPRWKSA